MNDWPRASVSRCASTRATTSLDPPGGHEQTMRTGLTGYACAVAADGASSSTAAASPALARMDLLVFPPTTGPAVMRHLLVVRLLHDDSLSIDTGSAQL